MTRQKGISMRMREDRWVHVKLDTGHLDVNRRDWQTQSKLSNEAWNVTVALVAHPDYSN